MLRLPPLGAIEAFVTVARLGSIKTAADALALSPSALSRRVQTLENRVGEALFERRHQALVLTSEGERLLESVAPLIDDLAMVFERMGASAEMRLRLGLPPLFGSHVLMPRLPHLREKHPGLHLDIDTAPAAVQRLGEGLEAAIALAEDIDPRFYARRIGRSRIVAIGSRALQEKGQMPKTPADLVNHTVFIHRDMPGTFQYWLEGQNLPTIKPAETTYFDSGQLILDATASGMGIAIMLDTLLDDNPAIVRLFDTEVQSPYNYWFVCRQAALSSKPVRLFHNWLFEEFPDELDMSQPVRKIA